ncbi:MAG: hypothetical protein KGJ23_01965 [Euryarchaeota archaeon]|nr:hypothetical protein [Euryarchaeota archaeon]MDE1835361.1 hypothetical protein [Euryarchaeota archaeon]MDE1880464.1 hypothetical protein [Euryarchaeota archaeon]MDE2043657.1 hypothetical protein [Thermoplasmata archaeon]
MSIDLLRVGIGIVWSLNLIFILDPSNQYFAMFQMTAAGFGPTSVGGSGFADFVANYPVFFAWVIALLTAYLAVAFLAGFTTRLACVIGALASVAFLLTQFYATFTLSGMGTDVGPHPLYVLIYLILFTGGAGQYFAIDHWVWASGKARFPRLSRWIASPRDLPCNATCPHAGPRPSGASLISGELPPLDGANSSPSTPPKVSGRGWAALGVFLIAVLLLAAAVVSLHPGGSATPPPATQVSIQDVQYTLLYPGNASQGGLGPAHQDGCFDCAIAIAPGSSVTELFMVTNNHSGSPTTVSAIVVGAPFSLAAPTGCPRTLPVGYMWMFNIDLRAPDAPGTYTVALTITVT